MLTKNEQDTMIELTANLSEHEWKTLHKSFSELRSQVVIIKHHEFAKGIWYLRLPEQITTDKDVKTGPYQVGMNWGKCKGGWQFGNCPIVGLEGVAHGMICSKDADTIDFSITVENHSENTWQRALAWLCFNHSHAKEYYRYCNFVCHNTKILITSPKAMEHYCLEGHDRDWWTRGTITPTEALIGTCCRSENQQDFCVAIGAEKAIMLGQNPGWPCTDIGLMFGNVLPGKSATVTGRVYFRKGNPDQILNAYRQDFGLTRMKPVVVKTKNP